MWTFTGIFPSLLTDTVALPEDLISALAVIVPRSGGTGCGFPVAIVTPSFATTN
jgi:hypothetical protein